MGFRLTLNQNRKTFRRRAQRDLFDACRLADRSAATAEALARTQTTAGRFFSRTTAHAFPPYTERVTRIESPCDSTFIASPIELPPNRWAKRGEISWLYASWPEERHREKTFFAARRWSQSPHPAGKLPSKGRRLDKPCPQCARPPTHHLLAENQRVQPNANLVRQPTTRSEQTLGRSVEAVSAKPTTKDIRHARLLSWIIRRHRIHDLARESLNLFVDAIPRNELAFGMLLWNE